MSPHCDDGVLSLGATAWTLVRSGLRLRSLTVFGGRADETRSLSLWDQACGFEARDDALATRHSEERDAWALWGIDAELLALEPDDPDDLIGSALVEGAGQASLILIPGFPLVHPDHVRVNALARKRFPRSRLGLYVEQPYALHQAISGKSRWRPRTQGLGCEWSAAATPRRALWMKRRGIRVYRSQLNAFRPFLAERIIWADQRAGGERVRLLDAGHGAWADIAVPQ